MHHRQPTYPSVLRRTQIGHTHYGLERLLYRLSVSPHAANYLLKGALSFSL